MAVVTVSDLPQIFSETTSKTRHKIYIAPVDIGDVFQRSGGDAFDRIDFQQHSSQYHSFFAERVAAYAQVVINCAYWDVRFPRLITKQQMKRLNEEGNHRFV
jgi:alpha-aminoadipic semialdehyde synthase